MRQTQKEFLELYRSIWDVYTEWEHASENELSWPTDRYCKYSFGPVIGMYKEKDERLLTNLDDDYTDNDVINIIVDELNRQSQNLQSKTKHDPFEVFKEQSCQKQLKLLEDARLDCWLVNYFLPAIRTAGFEVEPSHLKGFCYIYYGYLLFCSQITSVFNSDTTNLKRLYKNIFGKDSELHKYRLVQMSVECELMPIDPPRFYDSRIDKTIYLSNVPKEMLQLLIKLKKRNCMESFR